MIRRLLCWLGSHRWLYYYKAGLSMRVCKHCGKRTGFDVL